MSPCQFGLVVQGIRGVPQQEDGGGRGLLNSMRLSLFESNNRVSANGLRLTDDPARDMDKF